MTDKLLTRDDLNLDALIADICTAFNTLEYALRHGHDSNADVDRARALIQGVQYLLGVVAGNEAVIALQEEEALNDELNAIVHNVRAQRIAKEGKEK